MARDKDTIDDIRFVRAPAGFIVGAHHEGVHHEVTFSDHDQKRLMVRVTKGEDIAEYAMSAAEIHDAMRAVVEKKLAADAKLAAKAAEAHDS